MRPTVLLAAASLLPLAACGDAEPADEYEPEPMEAAPTAVLDPPAIPENSLGTIDFPGGYSRMGSTLVLNEDDTYRFMSATGDTITGSFTRMEDGSRIRLESFEGGPAWFSVGRGAIYRLPDESTPYGEITVEGEYRRDVDAPSPSPATPEVAEPQG